MKPCDLESGLARIRRTHDELHLACHEAAEQWNDATSRAFFEDRIGPVVPVVKTAMDATARMQNLLAQAMREVEG